MDPSLGFVFYLKDLNELENFSNDINKLGKENKDFFIYS